MSEHDDYRQRMKAAYKAHFVKVIQGQRPPAPDVGQDPTPPPSKSRANKGGVRFDSKGNAIWTFRKESAGTKVADDKFNPLDALDAALALAEDGPSASKGGRDPYDTGD